MLWKGDLFNLFTAGTTSLKISKKEMKIFQPCSFQTGPKITNFYKCTFLKVGCGLHLKLKIWRGLTLFKRNTFKCFAAIFLGAFFLHSCAFKHSLEPILLLSLFRGMIETSSFFFQAITLQVSGNRSLQDQAYLLQ